MNDSEDYFREQQRMEDKERRRNPNGDPDMLEPWGGCFKIKEPVDARIQH